MLRYLQGRSDGNQAFQAYILSGIYPVPAYYSSSNFYYSYIGYHAGRHHYSEPLRSYPVKIEGGRVWLALD